MHLKEEWRIEGNSLCQLNNLFWKDKMKRSARQIGSQFWELRHWSRCLGLEQAEWNIKITLEPNQDER